MKSLFLLPICLFVERVETYLLRTTTDVRINMITHPFITDFSLSFQKSTVFPICHSNLIRPTAQHGLISSPVLSVTFGALPYTHRTHLFWSHRTESNREPANLSINVQLLPPLPFVTVFPIHSLLQRKLL